MSASDYGMVHKTHNNYFFLTVTICRSCSNLHLTVFQHGRWGAVSKDTRQTRRCLHRKRYDFALKIQLILILLFFEITQTARFFFCRGSASDVRNLRRGKAPTRHEHYTQGSKTRKSFIF